MDKDTSAMTFPANLRRMMGSLRGRIYRVVMRVSHRFNWHYAPPIYPDGDTMYWCKWCGMRDVMKRRDDKATKIGTGAALAKLEGKT